MSGKIVTLSPKAIVTAGMQVRAVFNRAHCDELAELFDADNPTWPDGLPPVTVFHDGKRYYLADGHHRLGAAVEAGCTEIRVDVHKGTKEDALRYAVGTNAGHGLKRTNEDKRNAVRIAYRENFASAPTDEKFFRALARLCRVSHTFAGNIVKEIRKEEARLSGPEVGNVASPGDAESVNVASADGEQAGNLASPEPRGGDCDAGDATEADTEPDFSDDQTIPVENATAARGLPALPAEADYHELDYHLRLAAQLIDKIGQAKGGEMLRVQALKVRSEKRGIEEIITVYSQDLENLRTQLKFWRPHVLGCPVCKSTPAQNCNLCFGLPYLTRGVYDRLTDEQKSQIKESTHDAA